MRRLDKAGAGGLGRGDVFLAPFSELLDTALCPESANLVFGSTVSPACVSRLVDGWTGLELVNEGADLGSDTAAKACGCGCR